jgi:uncharacterized coiled-coil DUF342 family protein
VNLNKLEPTYQEKCRQALEAEKTRSLTATNNWAHVDRAKVHADWDNLYKQFATLIDTSTATDNKVQELVAEHYQIACRFYTPSKEAYIGMALFYEENADMKKFHNQYHPKFVEFLGDAICHYSAKITS